MVPSAGNGCLRREFNLTDNPPDSLAVQALQSLPPSTFDDFELTLRINLHDNVHCLIGGTPLLIDTTVLRKMKVSVAIQCNLRHQTMGGFFRVKVALSSVRERLELPQADQQQPAEEPSK